MNAADIKTQLMNKIYDRAEEIAKEKAETLASFIKYEISVANTELAIISHDHGYDFDCLDDGYADAVTIGTAKRDGNAVSLTIQIPAYAFKDVSESEFEYFKTIVLANAITKFKRLG